ncbi:MAG TPA: hypothetical protein VN861_03545 [Candidatus Acidoferrales bacterium]|nr:hypothetical protein [Candidatus Acidoferrales bacterium]
MLEAAWTHIRGKYSWRHPLVADHLMSIGCDEPGFITWTKSGATISLAHAFSAGIAWQASVTSKCEALSASPSAQPVAELIVIWDGKQRAEFASVNVGEENGYRAPEGVKVVSRQPLYAASPSTTGEPRKEVMPNDGTGTIPEAISTGCAVAGERASAQTRAAGEQAEWAKKVIAYATEHGEPWSIKAAMFNWQDRAEKAERELREARNKNRELNRRVGALEKAVATQSEKGIWYKYYRAIGELYGEKEAQLAEARKELDAGKEIWRNLFKFLTTEGLIEGRLDVSAITAIKRLRELADQRGATIKRIWEAVGVLSKEDTDSSLEQIIADLRRDADQREAALRKYGRHDSDCPQYQGIDLECICGLAEALASAPAIEKENVMDTTLSTQLARYKAIENAPEHKSHVVLRHRVDTWKDEQTSCYIALLPERMTQAETEEHAVKAAESIILAWHKFVSEELASAPAKEDGNGN